MAKAKKIKPVTGSARMVEDTAVPYTTHQKQPSLLTLDFTYRKFKKIADKVPFTQSEWAGILHLSERTLQRYAKSNGVFEGIYTDRILQMQELIDLGLETFSSPETFYQWLKKSKTVMGQELNFSSLSSGRGIQETVHQLSRIQQGIYA